MTGVQTCALPISGQGTKISLQDRSLLSPRSVSVCSGAVGALVMGPTPAVVSGAGPASYSRPELAPAASRAPQNSALTLVWTRQSAHLDLAVCGRGIGGAATGLMGPPGARKAQGAGQGAQHLDQSGKVPLGPSTTHSSPAESLPLSPRPS